MNNETVYRFEIKRRGDDVYDLYVNNKFMVSKGSIDSVIAELNIIMYEVDSYVIDTAK
jgi:hypothetical protein